MNNAQFTQELIKQTRVNLLAAMDAESKILSGALASYSFDSGQSKQSVTKLNITELRKYIDILRTRLQSLEREVNGGNPTYGRGIW